MTNVTSGPSARCARLPLPITLSWLRASLEDDPDVIAALLLGSAARGDHLGRSDLDLAILVKAGTMGNVSARLRAFVAPRLPRQFAFPDRSKVVAFSADTTRKADFFVVDDLALIARYAAGSRIPNPADAVLLDRTGTLASWIAGVPAEVDDLDLVVPQQATRFAYHFEGACAFHAASDMYRARYNLEIAFHCVAHLEWRAAGRTAFAWLPRDLLKVVPEAVAESLRKFEVPLDPSRFHQAKQHLLSMFCSVVDRLDRADPEIIEFCQLVLARDRWWNHRDAATFTDDRLARGVLFRSSSPHRYLADPDYLGWLERQRIRTRIDLRGAREKTEGPVRGFPGLSIEAAVDPWLHFTGEDPLKEGVSKSEASYRFTAFRCPHAFREVVSAIASDTGPVLVHCFAGVDRTGVIVALVHVLAGVERGNVLAGYSASSERERIGFLDRTLALVDERGGVERLAQEAGLSDVQISAFRSRMWT